MLGQAAQRGPENFVILAANKWGRKWEGRIPVPTGGEGAPASASGCLSRLLPGPAWMRAPRCAPVWFRPRGAGPAGRAHLSDHRAPRTRRARGRRTGRGAAASGRCHCGASFPRERGGRRRGRGRMAWEAGAGARGRGTAGAPAPGQGGRGPGPGGAGAGSAGARGAGREARGLPPLLGRARLG